METYKSNDIVIKYSNKDKEYINNIITTINSKKEELFNFFKINKLNKEVTVVIWDSIESYKNNILPYLKKDNREYKEWMIADTYDGNINMMTIDAVRTTKNREDYNLDEFLNVICHELVHICQSNSNINDIDGWLWEMFATNLGETPESYSITPITCELQDLEKDFDNVQNNYSVAYTFGSYLFEQYSNDEIYNLFCDNNRPKIEMPILFSEAKEWSIKNQKPNFSQKSLKSSKK